MAPKAKKNLLPAFEAIAAAAAEKPEPEPEPPAKPEPEPPAKPETPTVNKSRKEKAAKPDDSDSDAPSKPKRTRKPSNYNILLGEFMRKIALEEKEKSDEDRMPRNARMKAAQAMYRDWKAAHPVA